MKTTRGLKVPAVLITVSLIILLLPVTVLIIQDQSGNTRLIIPLIPDKDFSVEYIHSVHKTPVTEFFTVTSDNNIKLVAVEFQSYGAGMPFLPSEGTFTYTGDAFMLTGLDREAPEIILGYSPAEGQGVRHNKRLYLLKYYYYAPGSAVEIKAVSQPLFMTLLKRSG